MAAELEVQLDADSRLIQSSGGVFEVEYDGQLIFSKKALKRFPADGEVTEIMRSLESGSNLSDAQQKAAADIPPPVSFSEWLQSFLKRRFTKA